MRPLTFLLEKYLLQFPANQRNQVRNELITSCYRFVLPGLGWERLNYTAKLTADEKRAADAFAETLPLKVLPQILEALQKGIMLAGASKSSQDTYGARIRSALALIESEPWYPGNAILNRRPLDEIRPLMRYGHGEWKSLSLMEEKGRPLPYSIQTADMFSALRQHLDAFVPFMQDPDNADRQFDELAETTALGYYKGTLLWLGWLLYHDDPSLDPQHLTLENLVPLITSDQLEDLSDKQRKLVWTKAQRELEARISRYFTFLRTEQKADSPRTRLLKLAGLLMLAKFLYASEIDDEDGYNDIPIIRTILKRMDKEQSSAEAWEKDRRYVADQSRKWPEPPDGQSVLEYTQQTLIEALRLECRPRQSTGDFCKGHIIAKSLLFFLLFVDVGLLPPGRQQEPRSYRIALSCPIQRPQTVPIDGVCWPLPPDWAREKRARDSAVADNYLYKVYHYDGQFYEHGVWVREKRKYKTQRFHGKRGGVIDNIVFEDGHCLYDYIERYLCGQWYVGNFHQGHRYSWWDDKLQFSYGKWLSKGRAELCSANTPVFVSSGKSETWVASYLFLNFKTGEPFTDNQMSGLFTRNSYRVLGKRITPHTFRYMWATWAFQMELTYAELDSLAHGMGLTVKTLREMYERCSLTEKNRPINKVMRKLFPWQVKQESQPNGIDHLMHLKENIAKLTPEEFEPEFLTSSWEVRKKERI